MLAPVVRAKKVVRRLPMTQIKRWGIKVEGKWWVQTHNEDAVYYKRGDAAKDAADFNSLRIKKENIYTVEEYK